MNWPSSRYCRRDVQCFLNRVISSLVVGAAKLAGVSHAPHREAAGTRPTYGIGSPFAFSYKPDKDPLLAVFISDRQ